MNQACRYESGANLAFTDFTFVPIRRLTWMDFNSRKTAIVTRIVSNGLMNLTNAFMATGSKWQVTVAPNRLVVAH